MKRLWYFLAILVLLTACNDSNVGTGIPDALVNEQINVSSLQYPQLRQNGGYVYINGGYKGIIVVRQNANSYTAFERACPYDPMSSCMVEADESNLFLVDTCCGSQFNFQGQVMSGPAVYGLRQYSTSLNGSVLSIFN
ncbi:hypothetical protein ACFSKU_03470 [Pontibacter silvestris]|uniref:Rieske domain-containing protein n=1 Tax=Pontibacter silvestris TaxID=2305183 RepID=A0ABW4WT35_9BACT|nr:hypothetical protein [Pontibacter silvestris]